MDVNDKIKEFKSTNNSEILQEIIDQHSNIIEKIARFFYKRNTKLQYDDIKSSAIEGFIKAVYRFNQDVNKNFEWYSIVWMKACIRKYIMNNVSLISLTTKDSRQSYYSYYKESENNQLKSIIHNEEYNDSNFLSSSINQEEILERKMFFNVFNQKICEVKTSLNEFQKHILENRLLSEKPETLKNISEKFNVSNQTVYYNESKIIDMIKKKMMEIVKNDGIPMPLY